MSWKPVATLDPYQIADQRSQKRKHMRAYRARKAGKPWPPPPPIPPRELPPLPVIIERRSQPAFMRREWEAAYKAGLERNGGKPDFVPGPTPQERWNALEDIRIAAIRSRVQQEPEPLCPEEEAAWDRVEADPAFQAIRARQSKETHSEDIESTRA